MRKPGKFWLKKIWAWNIYIAFFPAELGHFKKIYLLAIFLNSDQCFRLSLAVGSQIESICTL